MRFSHLVNLPNKIKVLEQMRLTEIITIQEQQLIECEIVMRHEVIKPYHRYLKELSSFLIKHEDIQEYIILENASTNQAIEQAVDQAAQKTGNENSITAKDIILPPVVQKQFVEKLPDANAGPVPNFEEKIKSIANKIKTPEIRKSILDKIKVGIAHPATQTLIVSGVSNAVGMAAGALTMGLGKAPATAAASAIGTGLLAAINSKLSGQDIKTALKTGAHAAASGAASSYTKGDVSVEPTQSSTAAAKNNVVGSDIQSSAPSNAVDPQSVKDNWEKFVAFGQNLIKQMTAASPAPAK
jgi:hypothetical protein